MSEEPTKREIPVPDAIKTPPPSEPVPVPVAPAEPASVTAAPPVTAEREAIDPSEIEPTHETLVESPAGTLAPLSTRVIAGVIDVLIAFALQFTLAMILPNFFDRILWLVGGAYLVVRDSLPFLKGQSLGKTAMKLKVRKVAGGDLTADWKNAILRNVLLIVPFGGLVELIVLLVREGKPEQGRRLGDDWAETRVVIVEPS